MKLKQGFVGFLILILWVQAFHVWVPHHHMDGPSPCLESKAYSVSNSYELTSSKSQHSSLLSHFEHSFDFPQAKKETLKGHSSKLLFIHWDGLFSLPTWQAPVRLTPVPKVFRSPLKGALKAYYSRPPPEKV